MRWEGLIRLEVLWEEGIGGGVHGTRRCDV